MPTQNLNPQIITAAIEGFELQKIRIDQQIAELRSMQSGAPVATATTPEAAPPKRRKFSAAVKQKMREAQQKRWAKIRGEEPAPATPEAPKPIRKLSEEGKAAIVAALKKRWAAKKAAETVEPAVVKKAAPKKAAVKKAAKKAAAAPDQAAPAAQ